MPQRSTEEHHQHRAAATLEAPALPSAERLLARMADVAIDRMLSDPPADRAGQEEAEVDESFGAVLSREESAALEGGTGLEEAAEAQWPFVDEEAPEIPPPPLTTAMPTDEELEALLREPGRDEAPAMTAPPAVKAAAPGATLATDTLTDAAAALAAEMDEESAPVRRPLEPTLPSRLSRRIPAEEDADAIQAEGAIEARGSVNLAEPPAPEHVALAFEPEVFTTIEDARGGAAGKWWLSALVWLNAPLSAAPQSVRERMVKAAVLGLLNATAVLVYVLVVRR